MGTPRLVDVGCHYSGNRMIFVLSILSSLCFFQVLSIVESEFTFSLPPSLVARLRFVMLFLELLAWVLRQNGNYNWNY